MSKVKITEVRGTAVAFGWEKKEYRVLAFDDEGNEYQVVMSKKEMNILAMFVAGVNNMGYADPENTILTRSLTPKEGGSSDGK